MRVSASPVIAQESFTPITAGVRPNLTVRFSVAGSRSLIRFEAGSGAHCLIELDDPKFQIATLNKTTLQYVFVFLGNGELVK